MKRWQAILLQVGLSAGIAIAQTIPNKLAADITQATLAALIGYAAKKTSESNPDGTSAKTAWTPIKK